MIFDVHQYECRFRRAPDHLELYERLGRAAHERHLGAPVVFAIGETGQLDSITHIWAFEDAADRERRRAALLADPEWRAYLDAAKDAGNIVARETHILRAASFFKR